MAFKGQSTSAQGACSEDSRCMDLMHQKPRSHHAGLATAGRAGVAAALVASKGRQHTKTS